MKLVCPLRTIHCGVLPGTYRFHFGKIVIVLPGCGYWYAQARDAWFQLDQILHQLRPYCGRRRCDLPVAFAGNLRSPSFWYFETTRHKSMYYCTVLLSMATALNGLRLRGSTRIRELPWERGQQNINFRHCFLSEHRSTVRSFSAKSPGKS